MNLKFKWNIFIIYIRKYVIKLMERSYVNAVIIGLYIPLSTPAIGT